MQAQYWVRTWSAPSGRADGDDEHMDVDLEPARRRAATSDPSELHIVLSVLSRAATSRLRTLWSR